MRQSKSHLKFLSSYLKTIPVLFSVVFMVGCSAFQIRYETEIKEAVPVGYKYIYIKDIDYRIDSYLVGFLSRYNIARIYCIDIKEPSKTLLIESSAEKGIVFPPVFFHDFKPVFYFRKTAETKIYDYSTKKLYAIVKYERGMFRSYERDQEQKFHDEYKKIFMNYKIVVNPIEKTNF